MKTKIIQCSLLLILCIMFVSPVRAQNKLENIKGDIRIMETILDQLLQASRNYLFSGRNIKGFYFDEYGLLFTVNLENQINVLSYTLEGKKVRDVEEKVKDIGVRDSKNNVVIVPSPSKGYSFSVGYGIDEEEFTEWIKKLDKKIQTFMGSYVDVGNHLDGNEKVSVVVFLGKNEPKAKVYQLIKKNISDFRSEKVTDKTFAQKITKQLVSGEDHSEEIDIMATIIKTSLHGKKRSQFLLGDQIHGILLKDLGVMFSFGDHFFSNSLDDLFHMYVDDVGSKKLMDDFIRGKTLIEESDQKETEKKKQFREKLSKFEDDIIKIIGQYGSSSFRFLPNDQSVFVLFGTERYSGGEISNVIIRLKKADLIAYSQDKLTLEKLHKLAQIIEY